MPEREHQSVAPIVGSEDPRRFTDSGIEVKPVYAAADLPAGLAGELGEPGEYPFTRGVHAGMYRERLWTIRQYAGYASARESNQRYRYLLEHGSTGLSMAFDLPTQLGLDSDDPRCLGEVGRTGVAIDCIDDMRTAFDGIPLDQVSTSMTINAPAAVLLLLYELVGEEQGVPAYELRGTVQNDILKEYIARGNFIYPPEGAVRLTTDLFSYCREHIPRWNTISISGYHFREKGASAVQEVAFTLCNGIAYVQAALDAGLQVDEFAPRLAFFFNAHNNVFQEVAKFRAARRMWAQIMRDRFGARDQRSLKLRFHTQTGGVTLTAQQPENNIVRVALQGFAAVCGGTQSLHTNGFDEALALPTENAAKIAVRTQQILAYESGVADTVDPFAGSYFVEALTDEIEQAASELIARVDELGGAVAAIDFVKAQIEESAFGYHERYRTGQDTVVGVNRFVEDDVQVPEIMRVDPGAEHAQVARLKSFKQNRDQQLIDARLQQVREAARGSANMLPPLRQALKDRCTLGEVCGAMQEIFGRYQPTN
jgi:methylmalonyl-CoA mutase N-terminal domain/subunit